ncbi:MAG: hypothetical protein ABW224_03705 [Kibdelosporangium sp.]
MSTTTEAEYIGEDDQTGTGQQTEEHPPYEHRHEDGTVHHGFTPMCGGLCPQKPPPAPEPPVNG